MAKKVISVLTLAKQVGLTNALYFRPKAKDMFEISTDEYGIPLSGDIYVCDLTGIEDCSCSFVDEFIHNWVKLVRDTENAMFVLVGVSDDVSYTIRSALNLRNKLDKDSMIILSFDGITYQVIGDKLEKNAQEVFNYIVLQKTVTVRMVAEKFSLELNGASNRLKKLYDARLVMREGQSAENGGKYEYFLPKI